MVYDVSKYYGADREAVCRNWLYRKMWGSDFSGKSVVQWEDDGESVIWWRIFVKNKMQGAVPASVLLSGRWGKIML